MKPVPLQFVLATPAALALFISLMLYLVLPDWRWHHASLHSAMEALGGLSAIVMAIVLFQRDRTRSDRTDMALAMGFLSMGVLEELHAIAAPGNGFILLRSLASLCGGLGFALVWLPSSDRASSVHTWVAWGIAVGSAIVGLAILSLPQHLPEMIRNGEFSPTAVAPTSVACILFLAAALWFFFEYQRSRTSDAYLFACLALLFGLAEFMFMYSVLWDARWWFWHVLRLTAYFLVLGYMVSGYRRMVADLKGSLVQTQQAEELVRRGEQCLRQALEDRERIAQDLHDGIIQSLFALGLSLERCGRLVKRDPDEVIKHLGLAVADLNVIIRDLRGYIVGLEPRIADGRELEGALALQLHMMEGSDALRVALHVDPVAAQLVTSEQATHLLYVAGKR